jgi:hypothetical protein
VSKLIQNAFELVAKEKPRDPLVYVANYLMTQSKNTEIKRVAVQKTDDLNKKQIKIKPEQIRFKEIKKIEDHQI